MANQELDSLSWLDDEINASVFNDRRHATRFRSLMQKLGLGIGNSLPFTCQDRVATKAAYRFLSSDRMMNRLCFRGILKRAASGYMRWEKTLFCSSRIPRHLVITGITQKQWVLRAAILSTPLYQTFSPF
ncbi:transposase [Buttiauxella sp. S04-F03]|uniref:IS4/Tn5 family transposase DNA-binding protein n=1 Tax=Buttiauxella sp. W03-F01 TaxID=2904524 RepID=UPI001E5F8F5D|nr:transposase [Buttiauxella sp. W03-F01]MCE0799472.1 transposase [Buttiauxella sp. W03-F01]